MAAIWDITLSNKPRRKGEVFVKRHDKFVMKLYKDSGIDPVKLGRYLCRQMNRIEALQEAKTLTGCVHDYEVEGDITDRYDGQLYLQCKRCGHIKE